MKSNQVILLIAFFCFYSCADIKVYTPSSRFISPESTGRTFGGGVQIENQGGSEITLDFDNDQLDNPGESRNDVSFVAVGLELGIIDRLDFFTKFNFNSPSLSGLKYQILGENRKDATVGNNSLAVTIGAGGSTQESTSSSSGFFSGGDINGSKIKHNVVDASIIFGRRIEESVLMYASYQISKHSVDIELESDDNVNLDGKSFQIESTTTGASLGVIRYFGSVFYMNMELSAQKTKWTNSDESTFAFANLNLGWKWN
jgi:hypothetical protein